jgi:hypothetical protein
MAPTTRPSPRPRFRLESRLTPPEIRARANALLKTSRTLRGIAFDHHIELSIGGDERRFWSPQLVVSMRAGDDGGAVLDARFGPDPYVWAAYLMGYAAMLLVTLWAVAFGAVQWWLGQTPTALLVAPALAALAALVYGASFVGQGLGSEQMYLLRSTLVELCERP